MMRIFKYFLDNTFVVNIVSGFILIVGLVSLSMMKRDLHPPFEFKQIDISVYLPGASSKEMEKFVTYPIEEAIRGMSGVEHMRSESKPGTTDIHLEFEASYGKILESVEQVRSRVESIRSSLPQEIRYIRVQQNKEENVFLFNIGFENMDIRNEVHRQFYTAFEKDMLNLPGIVRVYKSLPSRDIYVEFDPVKLRHYEISTAEVAQVIAKGLNFSPVGQARVDDELYAVEIAKTTNSVEDILNLSIRSNLSGNQIRVRDVAKASYKIADQIEEGFLNSKPMAAMWVIKDTINDAIDLKYSGQKLIDKYNKKAPDNVRIVKIMDGPRFIEQQIQVLLTNGITGFILVFVILLIFLNWQSAILTALGIPFAYLCTFIVLFQMGIKIDLLSIIGLILVVGILVDDAIIISERYNELLSQGFTTKDAAFSAIRDMLIPVTGGILTTVVAFLPMLVISSGIAYVLMAVPVVVIVSLMFSWLECFCILPNHLTHLVKKPPNDKKQNLFVQVRKYYEKVLFLCLRFRYGILLGLVVVMAGSIYLATQKLQHSFDLNIGREQVSIYGALKESASVKESIAKIKPIENFLRTFPKSEIENVVTNVGSIWMDGAMRQGKRFVKIRAMINSSEKYPSEILKKVKAQAEEKIKSFKTDDFERLYVDIDHKGSEEKKKEMVRVRVRGSDGVDFEHFEKEVTEKIAKLSSIKEYVPDPTLQQEAWIFIPDRGKMAQYGLDPLIVSRQIRSYFTPNEVIETRINGEKIFVYTEVKGRRSLEYKQIHGYEIISPSGTSVPLSFIGHWEKHTVLKTISHEEGLRFLDLDFRVNTETSNKTAAQSDVDKALQFFRKKYPAYEFLSKNTNEDEEKNQAWGLKVALVCILSVFMVIALTLGSVSQAFIVGLPIPFGLIGIILALYLHNMPLGLMSIIGLVGTVGVSVNASIIIMDQINKLSENHHKPFSWDIIIEACSDRLRAIVLTTATTLGGLLPMAYSLGGESGFTQPLAFSMAWGLVCATLLTLFALPALVAIQEDSKRGLRRLWGKINRNKLNAHSRSDKEEKTLFVDA
ncbi:MAG: efflux RND transporter permease subunit [Bdellovibrionaceae bacterium]|nr:efflux RND transporter permease subunit [Pseudobdellovibrionaceae bacterium]